MQTITLEIPEWLERALIRIAEDLDLSLEQVCVDQLEVLGRGAILEHSGEEVLVRVREIMDTFDATTFKSVQEILRLLHSGEGE